MSQAVTLRAPEPVMGSETVSVTSTNTPVGLTASKYVIFSSTDGADTKRARFATISVDLGSVRVQFDPAIAPAQGGPGHLLNVGDILELTSGSQIINVRAVKENATNAALNVSYWGA